MKKIIAFLLAAVLLLSLCACGKDKKAFEASKIAYDEINTAYEITEQFGSDIYEAWRLGIYEKDDVLDDGVAALASELSLSKTEIQDGVTYTIYKIVGDDWDEITDENKQTMRERASSFFSAFEDDLFSFCVMVATNAYIANGKTEEAETALANAKSQMKELSEQYSDYEHYPNLKGFYTTTSSFFEFCKAPTGSFEQVKSTINDYKNEARDYKSDLDYIFEE